MPALQQLSAEQLRDAFDGAAQKKIPLTVTIRAGSRWLSMHSHFVAMQEKRVLVELPTRDGDGAEYTFAPGDKIGLSFKLKHHKHTAMVTVARVGRYRLRDGSQIPVMSICLPSKMSRLQRRAYQRAAVPASCITRASFWLGGILAEPAGTSPERPVWHGSLSDLSAGGFQVRSSAEASRCLETGDIVGVRIVFGAADESIFADAQYRHSQPDGEMALLGFQFVGLMETPEGQEAMQLIAQKVTEFQRIAQRDPAEVA